MAAVKHKITIRRRDDDPTKELILEHEDSSGGGLGELAIDEAFKVNSGDKVAWTSKLPVKNFAVLFMDEAPFNGEIVSLGGRAGEITLAKVAKKLGGKTVNFEYAVTVIEVIDGELKATMVDPTMTVDDSGGGTTP